MRARSRGGQGPAPQEGPGAGRGCRPGGEVRPERSPAKGTPGRRPRGTGAEGDGAAGTGGLIPPCGPGPEPHLPPAHQGCEGSPAAVIRPRRSRKTCGRGGVAGRLRCACARRPSRMPSAAAGGAPVAGGSAAFPVRAAVGGAWAPRCERGGKCTQRGEGGAHTCWWRGKWL